MSTMAWNEDSADTAMAHLTTVVHFLTLTNASYVAEQIRFLVEFLEVAQKQLKSTEP